MKDFGKETLEVMSKAQWYNEWILSLIKDNLKGSILEVGCGIGNFSALLAQYGDVTGIEINQKYINKLKENIKLHRNDDLKSNVGYGDIEKGKYFFKPKKFDTIICFNVLEHIKDDKKALSNMKNMLKKGGRLIIIVPAHNFLFSKFDKNIGHYRRYSKNDMKIKLDYTGLKSSKISYANWLGALGWLIIFKIFKKEIMPSDNVSFFDKIGKYFIWIEKFISPPFGLSVLAVVRKK